MRKITLVALQIFSIFAKSPEKEFFGREIMHRLVLPSGTVYPILKRMKKDGMLLCRREGINPKTKGRPEKIFYRINPEKLEEIKKILATIDS